MKSGLALIVFLAVCLGAGGLASFVARNGVRTWYPQLRKPAGTPPNWIFGPVWTTLYVMMAIAAWLVWREYGRGANPALLIFFAQLALNVAWPAIFFGSQMSGVALAEIVILWFAVGFNIQIFYWLRPISALLLLPYLLWVTYAAYLNFGIWRLNRK